MSYIRATSEYKYINEINKGDYVFWSVSGKNYPEYIEDYGSITDATLVDFIARILYNMEDWNDNDLYYEYLINKLAKRLDIKLKDSNPKAKERYDND